MAIDVDSGLLWLGFFRGVRLVGSGDFGRFFGGGDRVDGAGCAVETNPNLGPLCPCQNHMKGLVKTPGFSDLGKLPSWRFSAPGQAKPKPQ